MDELQKAILRTLSYADVFNYPLTSQEIDRWLIKLKTPASPTGGPASPAGGPASPSGGPASPSGGQSSKLKTTIQNLKLVQEKKGFYFLSGKEKLVGLRERREKLSQKKLKIAQKVASYLRIIPTIKMVGVTGALAMNNSGEEDDIDLLIVTGKNRLWLTRFLAVVLVELVARRRRPGDKEVRDKICLNMFLDENHLKVPKKEQDLFSAHEVCQVKPILDRDEFYKRFLAENQWVKKFLPNWSMERRNGEDEQRSRCQRRPLTSHLSPLTFHLERLAYQWQLKYMQSRKTTEVTNPYRILFHPQDCRRRVMVEYQKRLKKLGLYD